MPHPRRVLAGASSIRSATGLSLALLGLAALAPQSADAHGIEGKASLPVPTWLFAWGAAIVLVVSFVALSVLWSSPRLQERRVKRLFGLPGWLAPLWGLIGVALFAVVLYAGYGGIGGVEAQTKNLDPTFIYIIFWVGVPTTSALTGDWFSAFSPWRAVARAARWLGGRLGINRSAPLAYPERVGRWPVVTGLVVFGWLELVYHDHNNPSLLASLALAYFGAMLIGMALFGIDVWSEYADPFGGYFKLISRLGPLEGRDRVLYARRPFTSATALAQVPGTVALVLVVIGVTTFDGASNGVVWKSLGPQIGDFFSSLGVNNTASDELADSIGLLLAIGAVSGFFWLGILGMRTVSRRFAANELARRFAHTLVPIAFAYVLAHYFSLLIWQGQAIGYLVSDPLGHGANLFGTAHWHINYNVIGSTAIWYVQVGALIVGHVAGLTLAHDRALAIFRTGVEAVRSQYWMLAVMVFFTSLGLWLLSAVNT